MFEFNPDLVGADDDEADDTTQYIQSEDNDDDDANVSIYVFLVSVLFLIVYNISKHLLS